MVGENKPPQPQYTGDDPASARPDQCTVKNPNGDCYPTNNIGYSERRGQVAGNKMPNLRFFGYKNLESTSKTTSAGDMGTISLADLYDPKGEKFRVIRIIVGALWCPPCNQEASFLVQNNIATDLAPKGVVLINAIIEGNVGGVPATTADLGEWVDKHSLNFTAALDANDKFGLYWKSLGIPQNITIDARSMEIIAKESGFAPGPKVKADLENWVTWTMNNPPAP